MFYVIGPWHHLRRDNTYQKHDEHCFIHGVGWITESIYKVLIVIKDYVKDIKDYLISQEVIKTK